MPGVNFDRAAPFYDATRALPAGVPEVIRDALLRHLGAGPAARILEVGVGTGRILLSFARAGHPCWGVDLSAAMLGAFRAKLAAGGPTPRTALARADAMALPFADAAFDAVLLVHVVHLVADRRRCLAEAWRVLRPGGLLVVSANESAARRARDPDRRAPSAVTDRWGEILADLGLADRRRLRWVPDETLTAELASLGRPVARVVLARYRTRPQAPREVAAAHRDRVFSSDWEIPEAIHAEACRRLQAWLDREHPAPDTPVSEAAEFAALLTTRSGRPDG